MNNQVQQTLSSYKMTEMKYAELKKEQEVKEFKKCTSQHCHPAKCANYEYC